MKGKRLLSAILAVIMVLSLVVVSPVSTETVMAVEANKLKENTNYIIVSKNSGKALTIAGYSNANNAEICQRTIAPYEAQVWTLDGGNGEYQIVNKFSGKSLNVPGASTEAGKKIVQYDKENSDNSKWLITDQGNGYCRITPKINRNFGLNIDGSSKDDGARLIQWNYGGADNELWEFREVKDADIQPNPGLDKADAKAAIEAYITKFVNDSGDYSDLKDVSGHWAEAESIEVILDAYERYGDEKYLNIAEELVDGFVKRKGTNWKDNEYNDDIMWSCIMCARLYLFSNEDKYLTYAKENFDLVYDRAWDNAYGGGLYWKENHAEKSKNACVNGPGAIAACYIAQGTGDTGYYEKAKAMIEWEKKTLVQDSGRLYDNIGMYDNNGTRVEQKMNWAFTYNQGTYIGGCTLLYEYYKDQKYLDWAEQAAAYCRDNENQIRLDGEHTGADSIGFKGILARWLGRYALVSKNTDFVEYMQRWADTAWTNRNSDNLMWTKFDEKTMEHIEDSTAEIDQGANEMDNRTIGDYAAFGCGAAVSWLVNCADIEARISGDTSEEDTNWEVKSPDGNTAITVKLSNGKLKYSVKQGDATIVEESDMGINTSKGDFTSGLTYKTNSTKVINETYKNYSGIKAVSTNNCTEETIVFEKGGVEFQVIARAYNDGIAFRYYINSEGNIEINPDNEYTSFKLPNNSTVWYMNYAPYAGNAFTYEKDYEVKNINDINAVNANAIQKDRDIIPTMPMLYRTGDKYALILEAQKSGSYVGSMLKPEGNRVLRTMFDKSQRSSVKTTAPFQTPWRAMVIGDLATITSNTMAENLSPAPDNAQYHFDEWVEPGVSSWSWVASHGGGISDQANKETHKNWIDLAAEMGWKYYILDERWQPEAKKDGTKYEGFFDWFGEVRDYANEKGVKLIAWVYKGDMDTKEERESRFKEWSEAGIVGIKVDFFDVETQEMMQLQEDIYKEAAKYRMLVNVHGSNPPSGERRTYPNAIAREAIEGQEQGGITAEQYTLIPFIRAAVGTADVTEELYSLDEKKTSMGWQIALSVLVENGIRSLGGEPNDYRSIPAATSYYKNFPEKWDDVKLLDSAIGEYVNIARKTGDSWYAAGISVEDRDVTWKPDFLDADKTYTAIIYKEVDGQRQNLATETIKNVTKNTELKFHMQHGGGYAVKLIPNLQNIVVSSPVVKVQAYYTKNVKISYVPASTTLTDVELEVEDPTIVKVTRTKSGLTIKGLKEGTTKVKVKSVFEDIEETINVTVTEAAFDVADGWTVLNDDKEYLFTGENSVEVLSQNGVVDKNVFVSKAPEGDFEISMKISGGLLHNYQGGFVGVFSPENLVNPSSDNLEDNYVAVGRRYHTGFDTGGNNKNNHFAMMSNGEFYCADNDLNNDAYVKLKKAGNVYTGYYSYNGKDWKQIVNGNNEAFTKELNNNNLYIGFYAGSGGSNDTTKITFTDFKVNDQPVSIAKKGAEIQPEYFTVKFDSNGGTDVESQLLPEDSKVSEPDTPTRENYEFLGWYIDDAAYDFANATVNDDITLVAKWKANDETQDLVIEAETGKLGGDAQIVTGDKANNSYNGSYVSNIGAGTVSFTVNADADATRILKVYYASEDAGQLSITVNEKPLEVQNCLATGGWDVPSSQPLEVAIDLKEGENTIVIGGVNGAAAPNVDRIQIILTSSEAVKAVNSMIAALPADLENLSAEDKAQITAVQLSYNSLGDNKGAVSEENVAKLKAAVAAVNPDGNNDEEENLVTVTKEALAEAIKVAEGKNQNDYTTESWKVYQDALESAKAVRDKADATAEEVTVAANELKTAEKQLVKITDGTTGGNDNGTTGGNNNGTTGGNDNGTTGGNNNGTTGGNNNGTTGGNNNGTTGGNNNGTTGGNNNGTTGGNNNGTTGGNNNGTTGGNDNGTTGGNNNGTTGGNNNGTTGGNNNGTTGGNNNGTTGGNDSGITGGNDNGTTGGNNNGTIGVTNNGTTGTSDTTAIENVTQIITSNKTEKDIAGSIFVDLSLCVTKSAKNTIKLKWNKVDGAEGYLIFANKSGSQLELVKDTKSGNTKSWQHKKLNKGTYYKYMVVAYKTVDGKQIAIATSKLIHVPTAGGKYADIKSVSVNKTKVTLKKNKTFKIKAKEVKKNSKKIERYRKLSYESTNTKVATVSKSGKITAKSKGTCDVYVYAQNGIYKRIKVTVK